MRHSTSDVVESIVVALRKRRALLTQILGPKPQATIQITIRPNHTPDNIAVELHNVRVDAPNNTT